jgi:hypothetical protein
MILRRALNLKIPATQNTIGDIHTSVFSGDQNHYDTNRADSVVMVEKNGR